eukprot:CAMPEP_0181307162 /NCGR_PEP_ID=MMETSP1101-20121128/10717_1 /TAXON_ID=46948 /ORGANISM="Rhodomonas abbreviata, Strain Caron Lab Isolate" /LENGTH=166 /DNA_ID=CAMNT_0023413329 /DNA_START=207 /DNA_END=707 /DNA_ORIENTATION=-
MEMKASPSSPSSRGAGGKRNRRPPSLTPGLFVPLVDESAKPQHHEDPAEAVVENKSNRHSCPADMGVSLRSREQSTVSYYMRGDGLDSGCFRKVTGVLKGSEVEFMGKRYHSAKEFVVQMRNQDWKVDDESEIVVPELVRSSFNEEPTEDVPCTPRQPASWPPLKL